MEFFNTEQKKQILKEISQAELDTSGEIRVHIENNCKANDAFARGIEVFRKLNMHKTSERNGVLFYLALKDRKFAIIGDEGINNKVPEDFWDNIKDEMKKQFSDGNFAEGLSKGIYQAGKQLKIHFPYRHDDKNELSDEISFNEN